MNTMDVIQHNRRAWDRHVENGNRWTIPVDAETIRAARRGDWSICLTPTKPVPRTWFPGDLDRDILCLASGGGQQGPGLAAAGGRVTVFDNSPQQLSQDRSVAERENLTIDLVEGDMGDLSHFSNASFDLVVHPVSNCFVPDVKPVWSEVYRVLRPGGELLAGFVNPVNYLFDEDLAKQGVFQLKYAMPYSDLTSIPENRRLQLYGEDSPLEFGHTLSDQIGGQLKAGFVLLDLYEDIRPDEAIASYLPSFMATRALKPSVSKCYYTRIPKLFV
jgi:SAM-dependent methyltransferase